MDAKVETRRSFSRRPTARLLNNICLCVGRVGGHIPSGPLSEARAGDWGGIPQMNNFEHVRGRVGSWGVEWTSLNRSGWPNVTCDWPMPSWVVLIWGPPSLNRQRRLKTLPSRKLRMRAVVSVWQGRWDWFTRGFKDVSVGTVVPILRLNNIIQTSTYCYRPQTKFGAR